MLRVLGSPTKLCDGLTRRELLQAGGLGAFGVGLSQLLRLQELQASTGVGKAKAKACILLYPYGAPPQHETFDPKLEAPAEVQGEMKAISTSVPGLSICDHLPRVAQIMDRLTVVRSMTHPYPLHSLAYVTTGIPTYNTSLETRPRDPQHWPYIGSIVDYLDERQADGAAPAIPRNVGLPWLLNSRADIPPLAGPYAAFLGQAYDPFWADFEGPGTRVVPKLSDGQTKEVRDPFGGCTPEGKFVLPGAGRLPEGLTLDRLDRRRSLLDQFDQSRARLDLDPRTRMFDRYQNQAFSLLTSNRLRDALDISREPAAVRESYGMTLFGQSCLAARRLVEAGTRFVTVFWDAYEIFAGCAWDTHANHYPRLKEYLLPGMDWALSGLILDLEARGLLDDTLVLWLSEHGRTPQIDSKPKGAGRHHWSRVYSIAAAGGGVPRGKVVGSSDQIGGDVKDNPVSPKDILATTFHLLGIDPHTLIADRQGRPLPIAGDGRVREELCA
jgi:hypothetical protein